MLNRKRDPGTIDVIRLGVALAGSLLALSAFASIGAQRDDVPSAQVRYGDLDLATDGGNRALYRRIQIAAKRVCPEADNRDLTRVALVRACREDAVERAVRGFNSPRLAAVHAGQVRNTRTS